ncbi:MAG: SDR family NAD(P)-dependent oxidoreductase [Saprospiraceae bacterium]|nr:SDR family NAD(P)-dependent oxidoreductase [Saprospiraceae bacterium]
MNAVITGGSKGMGLAIAEIFATNGFEIAVTARTQSDLEALQQDFATRFPDSALLAVRADLSQKEGIQIFTDAVSARWPTVDVLVNNLGQFLPGKLLEDPDGFLEKLMQVNFWSAYHLTRALAPAMVAAGKGHIFNICSVASQAAYPDSGAYAITKFALLGFTKSLRFELRESGVKVTAVLPGATWTSSWEGAALNPGRLIAASDVAKSIYHAWDTGPSSVVEEIILRPQLGDL